MFSDSRLSGVPDAEVVARLSKLMESGRRVTAEIVMHLAEIEERRLHLKAGHNSLFAYCIAVHRMSEDEACRRIDVARLGRRFSTVFDLLASGALSLSVAALLKDCLTVENQTSLLAAVSGKSVRAAREELAARFPVPDVPSTIRRLPGRVGAVARTRATSPPFTVASGDVNAPRSIGRPASCTRDIAGDARPPALLASRVGSEGRASEGAGRASEGSRPTHVHGGVVSGSPMATDRTWGVSGSALVGSKRCVERSRVEPLALGRYRVQFTASLAQKEKLELALDLMSHRNPGRDLAAVVETGLDLLIEALLQNRFGKTSRPRSARGSKRERVSHETRRVVVDRDGLRCAFVDEQGSRCEGRAFLEFDHVLPLGKDGDSQAENVRILCRSHNRLCAELEYGRSKIEREIARKDEADFARGALGSEEADT